jgi:hypothetical protein
VKKLTAAAVGAILLAPAAFADVNVGTKKLVSDGATIHAVLHADTEKVRTDSQLLRGAKKASAAKLRLGRDLQKLAADLRSAHQGLEAARQSLKADLRTPMGAKSTAARQRAQRQIEASLRQERRDVQSANRAAKEAAHVLGSR